MQASSDRLEAGEDGVRASDAERDQAINELRDRFAEGRLSQDTFLYRMDAALRAKDRAELSGLLADLPQARRRPGVGQLVRQRLSTLRQAVPGGRAWTARRAASRGLEPVAAGPQLAAMKAEPPALRLPPRSDGRFTIGRALACDFTLADLSVSRWHAKLHKEDDGWQLSDLGSTNGTRLNGWRVTTGVPVRPGDQVSFGAVAFVITDSPAGLPSREDSAAGRPAQTGREEP